jgi:hypothetical protein
MAGLVRETEFEKAKQSLEIAKSNTLLETKLNKISNSKQEADEQLTVDLATQTHLKEVAEAEKAANKAIEEADDITNNAQLEREKNANDAKLEVMKGELELKLEHIAAEVKAVQEKGKAITPQLIAALQSLGDKQLTAALSENASLLGMLGGKSVVEVIQNLLSGTKLSDIGSMLNQNFLAEDE